MLIMSNLKLELLNVEHFLSNLNGFKNFIILCEGSTGIYPLVTAEEINRDFVLIGNIYNGVKCD